MKCIYPDLTSIPKGKWYCGHCGKCGDKTASSASKKEDNFSVESGDKNDEESIKNDGIEEDNPSSLSVSEEDAQPKVALKLTGIQLQNSLRFIQTNIECMQEVPSLDELKRGIMFLGYGQP